MSGPTHPSRGLFSPVGVTVGGLVLNVVLSAAKIAAGLLFQSQTIFADGLHSLSDAVSDVAVLAGLRISRRPADADHHYGHRRAMTLATAVLALLLIGAAVFIGREALRDLAGPAEPVRPTVPLILAIVSVIVKEGLYHVTVRVGRRTGDTSLIANAWHHRSDAFSSIAAAAGLAAVAVGGPRWHFVDHVTALVLAAFLGVIAWRLLRDTAGELMDRAPGQRTMERIEQAVTDTPGVRTHHGVRARRLGGKVDMDIHVQVDPRLTVAQGHDIAREVRRRVTEACPSVLNVIVHVEPDEAATDPRG